MDIVLMKNLKLLPTLLLLMVSAVSLAQKGTNMELWPKGAPNSNGDDKDRAELTVYLPDAKKATGRAVVCCPGGGYSHLAMDHEGHQWATFFNNQGIALVVLKYRMPHGNPMIPISDAEEAMKTVRRHAVEWHIDRNNVGIMGFSAGGHLASTIATHSTGDAAPNFQILFYPVITMDLGFTHKGSHDNFLGEGHSKKELRKLETEYSNDLQVNRISCPQNGHLGFVVLSNTNHFASQSGFWQGCIRSVVLMSACSHSPAEGRSEGSCSPWMNALSKSAFR